MTSPLLIPCPHCQTKNRVPSDRLLSSPVCGRCKQAVLLEQPFELDASQYASQITGDLPVVIDVWAPWCGPCRSFAPTFAQAAKQLKGRCRFAKLNSEVQPQLATQLGIRSIPTLILLHQGQELNRQSGALPLPGLISWLARFGIQ